MKTRVCTLMWGTAWERYGEVFVKTFDKFWPKDVELFIVTDRDLPVTRATQILLQGIDGYSQFMERWVNSPMANGREVPAGMKVDDKGYSFRYDAIKWMPQAIAPNAALDGLQLFDKFVWLDADVETTGKIRNDWIDELLDGHDVACLQRENQYTEIGFYAMEMTPTTRRVLDQFSEYYLSDQVFYLKEWHSAFVWDASIATEKTLNVRGLCPGKRGHVWPLSPLAEFTVHKKGKRKPQ